MMLCIILIDMKTKLIFRMKLESALNREIIIKSELLDKRHYSVAIWEELRNFYESFSGKEVCFRSEDRSSCMESVTDIIKVGLECYIPNTLKTLKKDKPFLLKRPK